MNLKGRVFAYLPPDVGDNILARLGRLEPWHSGFDFTPPHRHDGEEVGPPDFVGIGAPECGARWWCDMVFLHPGVAQRAGLHKQLHFFDRFGGKPFDHSNIDQYHGWFPRRPGMIAGEWTPEYFEYPWAPKLLQSAAPEARLLLVLRDPVERIRSTIGHPRPRLDGIRLAEKVNVGLYNMRLERWFDVFDPSQFLILQYERCVAETETQLQSTFDFLGLTEYHSAETERPRDLDSPQWWDADTSHLDVDVRERLVTFYEADVSALARNVPHFDLSLWPNFAHLAERHHDPDAADDVVAPSAAR